MKPRSTTYEGYRPGHHESSTIEVDGFPLEWERTLDLRNHSPTGCSWGYHGSGPSQCSLAILCDFLQDDQRALAIYQEFKQKFIAQLGAYWCITGDELIKMVEDIEGAR